MQETKPLTSKDCSRVLLELLSLSGETLEGGAVLQTMIVFSSHPSVSGDYGVHSGW